MLKLTNLRSPKGANKNTKRIGRGQASGQGTQAGKGHKGQKARKSGHVRSGFEGGAMPMYIKLPKRGFKNAEFKQKFAVVTFRQLNAVYAQSEQVDRSSLIEKGILKGVNKELPVKILATGKLDKALTFSSIECFSKTASDLITKIGGKIINS